MPERVANINTIIDILSPPAIVKAIPFSRNVNRGFGSSRQMYLQQQRRFGAYTGWPLENLPPDDIVW